MEKAIKKGLWRWLMLLSWLITPLWAATQTLQGNGVTFTYDDNSCGGGASAADCNTVMQNAFNGNIHQFQLNGLKDYLKSMSSAQAISTKGHGVDYTTNPSVFVLGATAGVAIDIGNQTLAEAKDALNKSGSIPGSGFGYQFSLMSGINLGVFKGAPALGFFELKRLTVYVHGGGYNFTNLVKQDGLTVKSSQFGFHTKYKLIEPKSTLVGIFNWGGFDFVTGLTYAGNTLDYRKNFDEQTAGNGSISSPRVSITPGGSINLATSALAIPFELATNFRILYFLSLFGGVGIDLNFGKSTVNMDVSSSSLTSTVNGVTQTIIGKLNINAAETSAGRFGDVRFFAGTAINLLPLKNTNVLSLVVQGNISTGGGYGVLAGVRAGW